MAWTNEEVGRYLETFKAYESKPPDMIKERVENDYLSKLTDCLTQIKSVNKTDVVTLSSHFGVSPFFLQFFQTFFSMKRKKRDFKN